jgi:hypothetical protein
LVDAVTSAVSWADGDDGRPGALAALALQLANELVGESDREKPAPTAQLSKELRATLDELEELRDSDDAQASLGTVLSSPVWDATQPGPTDAGSARRKGGRKSG